MKAEYGGSRWTNDRLSSRWIWMAFTFKWLKVAHCIAALVDGEVLKSLELMNELQTLSVYSWDCTRVQTASFHLFTTIQLPSFSQGVQHPCLSRSYNSSSPQILANLMSLPIGVRLLYILFFQGTIISYWRCFNLCILLITYSHHMQIFPAATV